VKQQREATSAPALEVKEVMAVRATITSSQRSKQRKARCFVLKKYEFGQGLSGECQASFAGHVVGALALGCGESSAETAGLQDTSAKHR
jgi:hypothetical protein